MGSRIISLFVLLPIGAAFADCPSSEINLFSCSFDNGEKAVEICLQKTDNTPVVTYEFGVPYQNPELRIQSKFGPANDGEGYRIWYDEGQTAINFTLGNFVYSVEPSIDGSNPDAGFLTVDNQNGNQYSNNCDKDSLTWNFDPLWEELDRAGWYYIYDSETIGWIEKTDIK